MSVDMEATIAKLQTEGLYIASFAGTNKSSGTGLGGVLSSSKSS